MGIQIPGTLAALLAPPTLSALETACAPPRELRAPVTFELEVEAAGEGTWVLRYEQRGLIGKKGFAKSPLLSLRLGKGALGLLRDELQAAVDGFPAAPELARRLVAARGLDAAAAAAAHVAIAKLGEGHCIHFDVVGEGVISVARGPVDEATRELTISLDGRALRALLTGAPLSSVSATMKGDRSVGTAVLAALGPVMKTLQP
jgi:hypothetical protein